MAKIYLKLKKQPKDLKDLFNQLFSIHHNSYFSSLKYSVKTYFDEQCTSVQCNNRKRRSFEDLLDIAQTYFPETTIEEVFKTLLSLEMNMYPYACPDIKKISIVLCTEKQYKDSEHWDKALEGKWSVADLAKPLGCNSFKELYDYAEKLKQ